MTCGPLCSITWEWNLRARIRMGRSKKIKWNFGDVFAIPLLNGKFAIGQVLDLIMTNVIRCALFDEVIDDTKGVDLDVICNSTKLISLIASSREQLDYGVWEIIGNKKILIPKSKFPYEKLRDKGWVGATFHDAALVEDFLNAFHALSPWDDWHDPNYLDEYLIDKSKKPPNLILSKKGKI